MTLHDLYELWQLHRDARRILASYRRLDRGGKHFSAYGVGCSYNNHAHRYNLTRPRLCPAMRVLSLEVPA